MSKLLVKEIKGSTFRLFDLETKNTFRVFQRDFKEIDLVVGSLLDCEYDARGDLIEELTVNSEIVGDSSKERVKVDVSQIKVGDLVDNVPVLSLGKVFAEGGKKLAYAYFK